MKNFTLLLFTLLMLLPISIFTQQAKKAPGSPDVPDITKYKIPIPYQAYTTEDGLVKHFYKWLKESETIIDAQVISRESKWGIFNDDMLPNGYRQIYTAVTFKVYQWIKGSLRGDTVSFNEIGGKIGDTETVVQGQRDPSVEQVSCLHNVNERAIFFFKNKDRNTLFYDIGRYEIHGSRNGRHGWINLAGYIIDAEDYAELVKHSITDTTAYRKFIRQMKMYGKKAD